MHIYSPKFYIEINKTELKFIVVSNNKEESKFDIIFNNSIMLKGIANYKIVDYDLIYNLLKENIYKAEQQLNLAFKEVFIVIDNFNFSKKSVIILLISDSFFPFKSWEFEINIYIPKFKILEG